MQYHDPRPIRSSRHLSSRCWFDDSVGLVFAIPITIVGVLYAKWLGNRIYQIPTSDGMGWTRNKKEAEHIQKLEVENNDQKELPSVLSSFAPIVIP